MDTVTRNHFVKGCSHGYPLASEDASWSGSLICTRNSIVETSYGWQMSWRMGSRPFDRTGVIFYSPYGVRGLMRQRPSSLNGERINPKGSEKRPEVSGQGYAVSVSSQYLT